MSDADAYDLDAATSSLLADGKDIHTLIKVLAKQLGEALGERLAVERKGGFLHHSDEIKALQVNVANEDFRAELSGGGVACTIAHASGGIRIRNQPVEIAEWVRRLLASLQAEAAHSQAARLALENLVIGGPA